MNMKRPLAWKQQDKIDQVAASLAIEDMPLTEQDKKRLESIARKEKTARHAGCMHEAPA